MNRLRLCLGTMITAAVLLLCAGAMAEIRINEVMASNGVYQDGHAYDWAELYNDGAEVSLAGWYLSNDPYQPYKWAFPSGAKITENGYLIVYCAGEGKEPMTDALCTNFKLSADGDTLYLTSPDGESTVLSFGTQFGNVSYGLAGGEYRYLEIATPGSANPTFGFEQRAQQPVIETAAGFYANGVIVHISAADGAEIHYTTDCSTPTRTSPLYTGPISISATTVIRAIACAPDQLCSAVAGATYFINDSSPVPVVSLYTDNTYLFDNSTGVMVKGTGRTPNYMKNLQYPCQLEYFDENGQLGICQMGTFKIAGKTMRTGKQKSLAVYARKAYGSDTFGYPFFEDRDYDGYSAILLRYTNSDFKSTRLRDAALQELAKGLGLYYQAGKVIQVYLNGQYWGHYNLRERANRESLAQWEGIADPEIIDGVDILEATGVLDEYVVYGSNAEWKALVDFCKTHDMNNAADREYLLSQIDVDNWFTHAAYAMIIGNADANNTRYYRFPGGKWKFMVHDLDVGCSNGDDLVVDLYLRRKTDKASSVPHWPITALLEVPEYRDKFLRRLAEVIQTNFLYDTQSEPVLTRWRDQIELVMPRHIAKFKTFPFVSEWKQNVRATMNYTRRRPRMVINWVCQRLHLTRDEREAYFRTTLNLLTLHNEK